LPCPTKSAEQPAPPQILVALIVGAVLSIE